MKILQLVGIYGRSKCRSRVGFSYSTSETNDMKRSQTTARETLYSSFSRGMNRSRTDILYSSIGLKR